MENRYQESNIEGRNAVLEAFRSGRTVDKLFVLEHCEDGPVRTILREAKKQNTIVKFVKKERLDQMSQTGTHQVVSCYACQEKGKEIRASVSVKIQGRHCQPDLGNGIILKMRKEKINK